MRLHVNVDVPVTLICCPRTKVVLSCEGRLKVRGVLIFQKVALVQLKLTVEIML